ncbi:MAG: HU family DNA-binding protein [Chloroflexi bacterium SZAS-1]|nr:HU family DNA-binding protein [Chloroflexi bacterium SZAS-1]HNP85668.1 HU family DNA-binding protein [Kouleothrix sp.]
MKYELESEKRLPRLPNQEGGLTSGVYCICTRFSAHTYIRGDKTMQKTDFVKSVAERAGVSQKEAKLVVDAALDIITETLKAGEKVTLTGFGTFEVRQRQEREGVNPQTRQKIKISATKTPGFSASSTLKEAVKGN